MSSLSFLVVITSRNHLPEFGALFQEQKLPYYLVLLAHGTANNEILRRFGLDRTEKTVCLSIVTDSAWHALKRGMERKLRIDVPGTGVAFTVPLSSIGGKRELAFLTEGQNFAPGEVSEMKGTERELLVVVANRGHSHTVMEAANKAGATGGTVIHARGTGVRQAEQFLGISLASEKSVILIVTATKNRNAIMQAIMEQAGLETEAQAVVFSLPVTDTAGLRLIEQYEEEEEKEARSEE